jgi:hypothetical protein
MGMGIERGLHGWVGLPPIELENCSWNYEVYEIWGLDMLSLESMLSGIYAVYGAMNNSVSSRIESLLPNSPVSLTWIFSLHCRGQNSKRTPSCIRY